MDRTTRRVGRLRAMAVLTALAGSLLAGVLPASAEGKDTPGKTGAEQTDTELAKSKTRGFSWA